MCSFGIYGSKNLNVEIGELGDIEDFRKKKFVYVCIYLFV